MTNKSAVQFRKSKKSTYTFRRLKYCKKCGQYDVLFDSDCPYCHSKGSFESIENYAQMLNHRLDLSEKFLFASLLLASVVLAQDLTQLGLAFAAGAILLTLYRLMLRYYKPIIKSCRLQKIVQSHIPRIASGLETAINEAVADAKLDRYKDAYEKLREVGAFLNHDQIKLYRIACLNTFIIRKDMELELETLIPNGYYRDFVEYLYEVSKVNRQLIRQSILEYVVEHRDQIETLDHGKSIIANVLAASIRLKHFALAYRSLIADYIDLLPKDRFLRLCHLIASSPDSDWGELAGKCKEMTRIRYSFDPDFQGIWQEGVSS